MNNLATVFGRLKHERVRVEAELRQLDQAIQALSKVVPGNEGAGRAGNHRMSAAARKRIAAAQRARWARFHATRKRSA